MIMGRSSARSAGAGCLGEFIEEFRNSDFQFRIYFFPSCEKRSDACPDQFGKATSSRFDAYCVRMTVRRVHIIFSPLNCRWAVTFEAPKVTKSASSPEGFFAAQALRCKARKTGATLILPGEPCAFRPCMQKR